ncbi:hypothetical protein V2J09_013397 [Rumex salicifolius]
MAIASSAAESATPQKGTTNRLENPMAEEENNNKEMKIDDPQLGNPGSSSGDFKEPEQINSGAPIAGDQGSKLKIGKACHQCRQKIQDNQLVAKCQNIKKNKKCVIRLCCKCLKNRYFEKLEEVALVADWKCPKCRGICNCSFCMRKRGKEPTGTLSSQAKASGFSSVLEMYNAQGTEILNKLISVDNIPPSDEDCVAVSPPRPKEENHLDQTGDASLEPMDIDDADKGKKTKKAKQHSDDHYDILVEEEPKVVETLLPQGTELTNVAELELPAEHVGNALQFIEFCCTFGEIINIKKGQAESILYDIIAERSRPGKTTSLVQFQIQLLTLIKDLGEESPLNPIDGKNCWLNMFKDCISESKWAPKELAALDLETNDGYCTLLSSEKLRLLLFLCDETLETMPLRTWIEERHLKFFEEKKDARGKLLAAKEKEKLLKKQLHDVVLKATIAKDGASLSISEHEALVSERKAESERVHAEILETTALLTKYEQKTNALRTEPVFIDAKGHAFWNLKGCNNSDLVLQDMSSNLEEKPIERWYAFDEGDLRVIHEHISLHR